MLLIPKSKLTEYIFFVAAEILQRSFPVKKVVNDFVVQF